MMHQKDLFGDELPLPKTKEELNDVCCESCYTAQEKVCTCRCHGAYHGLGNGEKSNSGVSGDFPLSGEEAEPFRKQITDWTCPCGASLRNEPIMAYGPHIGGWTVVGYDQPLWLFIKCPKCKTDWSLWKIGVERERV